MRSSETHVGIFSILEKIVRAHPAIYIFFRKLIKLGKLKDTIKIWISSKSFLQNQVRSMVGCLKYLATNKWSIDDFNEAFKSKKRSNCAPPAPACGLYLYNIKY